MVGWPVLVPPHGPYSVVAVREHGSGPYSVVVQAVVWFLPTKIQKYTVSRPPEAHSSSSERF